MAKDINTYELEDGGLFFAPNEEQTEYANGGYKYTPPISKNTMSRDNVPYGNRPASKPGSGKPIPSKDFIERGLAAASLGLPFPYSYGASILGSGIDFYDAYNEKDLQVRNALLAEGALGLIPYGKASKGIKLSKTKPIDFSLANKILDLKDLIYPDNNIYSTTVKPTPVSQQLESKLVKSNSKPTTNYSKKTYDVYHSKDNKMVTVDGKKMTMDQFNNGFFKSHPGANYVNHVFEHGGIYFEEGGTNQFDFVRNQGQKPVVQDESNEMIMGPNYLDPKPITYKPMPEIPYVPRQYTTKKVSDWTERDKKDYTFDFYAGNNPLKTNYVLDNNNFNSVPDARYNYDQIVKNSPEVKKIYDDIAKKYNFKSHDDFKNNYVGTAKNIAILQEMEQAMLQAPQYYPSVEGIPFQKIAKDSYLFDDGVGMDYVISEQSKMKNNLKQDYFNYLDSPQYIATAKKMWGDDYLKHINEQKNRVQNVGIKFAPYDTLNTDNWNYDTKSMLEENSRYAGFYNPLYNNLYLMHNKDGVIPTLGTPYHEISHATDMGLGIPKDALTPNDGPKETWKLNPKYDISSEMSWGRYMDPTYKKWEDRYSNDNRYYKKGTEIRARVNALRLQMAKDNFDWNAANEEQLINYLNNIKEESLKSQFQDLIGQDESGLDSKELLNLFQNYAANENKTDTRYAENGAMIEMGGGGYTVTRSSDRKGKTHKVTGPDGTVKYFGDSNLGQHPNDPKRKAAFYARHKKNLAGNPYFRAFARKTWEEGGEVDSDREMLEGVSDILSRVDDKKNRKELADYMMANFRDENVTFQPDEFLEDSNVYANGGMIKRADGSYSRRGLWDNIRANKGSGRKPTQEMLRQEKKIKSQYENGGMIEMEDGSLFFTPNEYSNTISAADGMINSLYPAPSLGFQNAVQNNIAQNYEAQKAAREASIRNSVTPVVKKYVPYVPPINKNVVQKDNVKIAKAVPSSQYTSEDLEFFKRNNTPKELQPYYKKQLDSWRQGDIQEQNDITQRRIDVAKQAAIDKSKGLFTQAVAEDVSNGYRLLDNDNFVDDWINPFQWVLNPAGNLSSNFAVDAGPVDPYKVAMDAGLLALGATGFGEVLSPFAKNLARSGRFLTKQTPLRNAYNYNPWATKIEDAASKTVGKGDKAFIFDKTLTPGQRVFKPEPNFITGYKPIKDKTNLDFGPLNNKYSEDAKQEMLNNFVELTGGNADDIDLKQFVDFYQAQQNRFDVMSKYRNNLYETAQEQYFGTPQWNKAYEASNEKPRNLLNLLQSENVQLNSPLGTEIGMGGEGTVYELASDPNNVIKVGNTFKTDNADDLVKSFEGITGDNIAVVKRAYKDGRRLIEIMPNLNKNAQFNNLTKQQVLDRLELDARNLMNKGFRLDLDNLSGNFKYNPDKNIVDIYDISKPDGKGLNDPDEVVKMLRTYFNNKIPDVPLKKTTTTGSLSEALYNSRNPANMQQTQLEDGGLFFKF
jgi:hypothetical protein